MGDKIRLAQKLAQLSTQEEVRGSTRKFHQCKKDNLLKPHTNNYNNLLEVTKNDQNSGDFMEETAGFEPATVRFCKPFLWTTQARLHQDNSLQ